MKCEDCQFRLKCLTLPRVDPSICGALLDVVFQCIMKWNELELGGDVIDLQLIHTEVVDDDYTVLNTVGVELLRNARGQLTVESRYHKRESEVPGESEEERNQFNDW